jgi:hypothetical protein
LVILKPDFLIAGFIDSAKSTIISQGKFGV